MSCESADVGLSAWNLPPARALSPHHRRAIASAVRPPARASATGASGDLPWKHGPRSVGHRPYCPRERAERVRRHNVCACSLFVLDPADRDADVVASAGAVRLARQAPGCLDLAVSADPVDPTRVNVFERWARPEDLDALRATSGDADGEPVDFSRIRRFEIEQYGVEHPQLAALIADRTRHRVTRANRRRRIVRSDCPLFPARYGG